MANNTFIRQFCTRVRKLKHAKLTPKLEGKLRRHKAKLRMLSNGKTAIKRKRAVLSQRGGFLPLLMAAIPAIASVVGSLVR